MSADPTAEHVEAVAQGLRDAGVEVGYDRFRRMAARRLLTSTDPAVHAALAASLPSEVKAASMTDAEMLDALVRAGVLRETWEAGLVHFRTRRDAEEFAASIMPGEPIHRRLATPAEQVAPGAPEPPLTAYDVLMTPRGPRPR